MRSTPGAVIAIAVIAVIVAFYFSINPMESRLMPKCIFHAITGLECAGCGAQRMLHSLLHLDLKSAWRANALLLSSLPVLAGWLMLEMTPRRVPGHRHYDARLQKMHRAINSTTSIIVIATIIVGWTVVRNLI